MFKKFMRYCIFVVKIVFFNYMYRVPLCVSVGVCVVCVHVRTCACLFVKIASDSDIFQTTFIKLQTVKPYISSLVLDRKL